MLSKTGSNVVCCSPAEVLEVVEREIFGLVVLCHTLQDSEAAGIAEKVHQRSPSTRVMIVVSAIAKDGKVRDKRFDATSLPDPSRLITQATRLLNAVAYVRPLAPIDLFSAQ